MLRSRLLQGALVLAAASSVLTAVSSASATDLGHRFVGTVHGGLATEAGGGVTAELRLFDSICLGAGLDMGVNLAGEHGRYSYLGPAVTGSYSFKLTDAIELRPFFGARFPLNVKATDPDKEGYTISDAAPVAFTTALRLSYIYDIFVLGIQGDFTPHSVTWKQTATGKAEDTQEYILRAGLVLGVALGPYSP